MPDCVCGVAFADHFETILGRQSNFDQMGGQSVAAYFCPAPLQQLAIATGTAAAATLYSPVTALTPDQFAAET